MSTPTRKDLDHALAYAHENLRLGDEAQDPAEKHSRYVQAGQALGNASRIIGAMAAAIAPSEPGLRGVPLNYFGAQPAQAVLSGGWPR